jgi:gliding motility-associated-like protein
MRLAICLFLLAGFYSQKTSAINMLKDIVSKIALRIFHAGVVITICAGQTIGPNLVPNPSFEEYDKLYCGYTQSKVEFDQAIAFWKMPTKGTPDIYSLKVSEICPNHPISTSNISAGYQTPKNGSNMIGLITIVQNHGVCPEYREYIQVELNEPLQPGQKYFAGFYLSFADNKQYASNNLGMLFTEIATTSDTCYRLPFVPQVNFKEITSDKENWLFVYQTFISKRLNKFLTVGNFFTNNETLTLKVSDEVKVNSNTSYYFIDSVFVEPINDLEIPNVFTPNGDEYNQNFSIANIQEDRWVLTVINRWGRQVYYSRYYHNEWNGKGLAPGVYFYHLKPVC